MPSHEIVLPESSPETEWIRGRPQRKVSPRRDHARLQGAWFVALDTWGQGRGETGTEWRFRIAPPGAMRRPLVPDVAFISYERLRGLEGEDLQSPPVAPDVVVEILSPSERAQDVAHKRDCFLAAGTLAVFVVDPATRAVTLYERRGVERFAEGATVRSAQLPGFALDSARLFAVIDPPPA